MFSPTLYKRELRASWKMLVIFAAVLTMYISIIIAMYNPAMQDLLNQYYDLMPGLMNAVGFSKDTASLIGFISSYLYGFILIAFPMIFSILCGHRLIARYVDRGSMVSLLAAPVKRRAVAITQLSVLITGILALVLYSALLQIAVAEAGFPGELDISGFLALNAGLLCLHLFVGGICFFCSCLFSDARYSIGFGAGIPALAFVLQMLSNAGEKAEKVKYLTFFTLFSPDRLASGDRSAVVGALILLAGAVLFYTAAVLVFSKKDLHI
ncbi:MAG TPA: ABC transporter permease subunit [Clostridiales bacterium]|jgi:ABC-2 type transport system permease protein|nr:ABC transporter permease subunit [Clostridiales bacterium]